MRLFVAIDVPEDVRGRIARFASDLRAQAPRARWVQIEGAHLSLKFIGEVPDSLLDAIRPALAPMRAPAPIEIEYRGCGFFPNAHRPRVFWVGVNAPATLAELATEIERVLVPLGVPRESREFQPHLTLARFHHPSECGELRRAIVQIAVPEFGRTVAREFHLYQSQLQPQGPIYTRLETYVFAPVP